MEDLASLLFVLLPLHREPPAAPFSLDDRPTRKFSDPEEKVIRDLVDAEQPRPETLW